jgi:predicted phosphate transport protein (TIGR00153 family)
MVLARFLPHDEQFFEFFGEAAANAVETARLLQEIIGQSGDLERKSRRLRDLEHQGDEITHRVFSALNSTFVTPLDRDDIRDLAGQIDNLVDDLEEAGQRFILYKIDKATPTAQLFVRIIVEQAEIVARAVPALEHLPKRAAELRNDILEIHRLENEADDALSQVLAKLYDGVTEVPELIKAIRWGDLYALFEDATDSAEDIANTLEGIMLKNA